MSRSDPYDLACIIFVLILIILWYHTRFHRLSRIQPQKLTHHYSAAKNNCKVGGIEGKVKCRLKIARIIADIQIEFDYINMEVELDQSDRKNVKNRVKVAIRVRPMIARELVTH